MGGSARGGVATFHAALLDEFAHKRRHGIEVARVLALPPDTLDPARTGRCPAPVSGSRVPRRRRERRYARILERTRPEAVVFNHVTARRVAEWVILHRKLAPEVPCVGIVHSWHSITQLDDAVGRLQVAQEAIDSVQALCFGSEHCRQEGTGLGASYPQVAEVIHYPLQHAYLARANVNGADRRGVAYVGSLLPRKNLAALIEAVATRPRLDLTIAGEGEAQAELRALSRRLGAEDRIRFRGHYPADQHIERMRRLLVDSALLCLPSTSESFGLVMIEALACGTPVVGFAPTLAEIEELVGCRCGERLQTADPGEIAGAIDRVMAREWDRSELRGRTLAAFDPGIAASRYAELIRSLVSA